MCCHSHLAHRQKQTPGQNLLSTRLRFWCRWLTEGSWRLWPACCLVWGRLACVCFLGQVLGSGPFPFVGRSGCIESRTRSWERITFCSVFGYWSLWQAFAAVWKRHWQTCQRTAGRFAKSLLFLARLSAWALSWSTCSGTSYGGLNSERKGEKSVYLRVKNKDSRFLIFIF